MPNLVQIGNFIFNIDKFECAYYSEKTNSLHIQIDKEEYEFFYKNAEEMFNQLKELTKK